MVATRYRRDIDGLRAVAVLAVVFNHVLSGGVRGGYIGVDVFFVISGYLIGGIIFAEMRENNSFSISNFYERRIRRIGPAFFVMVLVTALFTHHFFLSSQLSSFCESMVAALLSSSNFFFWHEAGYFDPGSDTKPLLHTWSLGVEEQFYIFFPFLLLTVQRWWPKRMKAVLWVVAGLSFLATLYFQHSGEETAAFFFSPLRAWELLLGVFLSQDYLPKVRGTVQRNIAAALGLALIVGPAAMYTAATRFPGWTALVPCLGSALLIAAGESGTTWVGRALSLRPIVFVGLISYSLYLWHWPVKVLLRSSFLLYGHEGVAGDRLEKGAVLLLSFILAVLSWKYVETPFRAGAFRPSRKVLFATSGAAAILLAGLAGFIVLTPRGAPAVRAMEAYGVGDPATGWRNGECFLEVPKNSSMMDTFTSFSAATCMRTDVGRPNYLLYGDSHAADKYVGLSKVFPEINFLQATVSDCEPLLHEPADSGIDCKKLSEYIFGDYLAKHRVDAVVLSAFWRSASLADLEETIHWLHDHHMQVIVIGPAIQYQMPLPQVLAIALRDGRSEQFVMSLRQRDPETLDRTMTTTVRDQWHTAYISIYENLCSPESVAPASTHCTLVTNGVPLLHDTDHLTEAGSMLFAQSIKARQQI